eukprot:TRINITY_DN33591_c0_g1_i2.p1 TRINITY_DN33591_c0_g1~~TRINITY_DN33591_c0_g1_i2.p1  ORF type:complete len:180 (-),score=36.16 TRINITY_DN33591_c0_g1_i2:949-1488(-)
MTLRRFNAACFCLWPGGLAMISVCRDFTAERSRDIDPSKAQLLKVTGEADKHGDTDSGDDTDEESLLELGPLGLEATRRQCRWALGCLCAVVVLFWACMFLLPWGHEVYNARLLEALGRYSAQQLTLTTMCMIKEWNALGVPLGPKVEHQRSSNFLGLYPPQATHEDVSTITKVFCFRL